MSMTLGEVDVGFPGDVWPTGSTPDGLVRLAAARWPGTRAEELPVVAAFVASAFSPLAAAVADLCLGDYFGTPPADPELGERTAIVLASTESLMLRMIRVLSGGIMRIAACGRMIRPIACGQLIPSARAACICPVRTEARPPRTISAM